MAKIKIRYTLDAVNDLDSIFDYISDDNRAAAIKMLESMEKAILNLGDNPRMGTVVSAGGFSLIGNSYRKIIVKPYIIFYRIDINELYILRVLHSRQDWLHLIFEPEL